MVVWELPIPNGTTDLAKILAVDLQSTTHMKGLITLRETQEEYRKFK
jgi:hypothetical protein